MNSVIKLENIWKIYQLGKIELPVLRDISLDIKQGSFVTIMGPSGSGKSTLMYLLGILDVPTKGKIFLDGKDISILSENTLAGIRGRKIGFVFQQFNLLKNLSALENVIMPMIFQGVPEKERQERAKNLLASFGMDKRANHKPNELSGGEQQRVAIARSLANNPEIIIADEPTGNLDSGTGKIIMDALTILHRDKKKTVVVVTHDPNIANYSEEIVNIRDGQIIKNHKQAGDILWQK